jgi:hypothetical protein
MVKLIVHKEKKKIGIKMHNNIIKNKKQIKKKKHQVQEQ